MPPPVRIARIRSRLSAAIPMPSSLTMTQAVSAVARTVTRTVEPFRG
jgi:hypothetical protein